MALWLQHNVGTVETFVKASNGSFDMGAGLSIPILEAVKLSRESQTINERLGLQRNFTLRVVPIEIDLSDES